MRRSLLASLMLVLATLPGPALAAPCHAPPGVWGPFAPLSQSLQHLRSRHALTIVAVGSSSTLGTGASSPARSYPTQLARILQERFPKAQIRVINAGVGGDTVARNLARLERDVLAHHPDLVIWQVGTNDAFKKLGEAEIQAALQEGIARLRAGGAELVLMDPQYFPGRAETEAMAMARATVREAARKAQIGFLPRSTLMRHWIDIGAFSAATMLVADKIHMSDASYRCLAERVADLLPAAAVPASAPGPELALVAAGANDQGARDQGARDQGARDQKARNQEAMAPALFAP